MCHLQLSERHIVLLPHLISLQGVLRTGTYGEELQAGLTINQCLGKESWAFAWPCKITRKWMESTRDIRSDMEKWSWHLLSNALRYVWINATSWTY